MYEQQTEHEKAMKNIGNDLQVAEAALKKAMNDKVETDETVKAKEGMRVCFLSARSFRSIPLS